MKTAAPEARANDVAERLSLIADTKRLLIPRRPAGGEASVGALQGILGQSALSQHLAKLRDGGIVETRRKRTTIYDLLSESDSVALISALYDIFRKPDRHEG